MDEPAKYLDFPVPPGEADELTRGSHPVIWNNKTKRALIGPRNAFHYQLRDAAERLGEGFGYDTDGRIAPASPGEDRSYVYEHYDPYTDEREVYSHIQPFVNKRFPHYDFRPPGPLNHHGYEADLWNFDGDSHFGSVHLLDAPVSPIMNVQEIHGDSRPVVFIPESRIAILGGQNVTHDQITPRKLVQGKTPINGRIYQNTLEFFAPHPGQIEPHHQELLEAFAPHGVTRIVNGQWHAGDGPSEEDQLWNFSKVAYDNPNWSIMPEGESIQGSPNIQVMTPMPREEGRRVPFLTTVNQSYDKSRLYFGRPGDSHHDIAMRHKLGEDEEWDEDAYGGVEDGRYHELYADGVHGPELAEIMERNGFPEKPDDDDWTFSRTKSSSLREQSLTDLINGRVPRALSNNKPMWNLSSIKTSSYGEPHYNPYTGLSCTCAWGSKHFKRPRLGSVEMKKLLKQNQKVFRSDEGQEYLDKLGDLVARHPHAEPLVPWIASRFKHGDIKVGENYANGRSLINRYGGSIENSLPRWTQWMNARQHPLRRGQNIMSMSHNDLEDISRRLQDDVESKQKVKNWLAEYGQTGKTVHDFKAGEPVHKTDPEDPDYASDQPLDPKYHGWTIRKLENARDCEGESNALGHCIGHDDQPYKHNITNGTIDAYSLRDEHGFPKASWHFNEDGSLAHLQGASGDPKQEYRDLISHYHNQNDMDDDEGGQGDEHPLEDEGEASWEVAGAHDVEDYLNYHHPEGDGYYNEAYEEANQQGASLQEDAEVTIGSPEWDNIISELPSHSPQNRQHVYNTVLYNSYGNDGHAREFENELHATHDAMHARPDIYTPEELHDISNVKNEWAAARKKNYTLEGQEVSPQWNYKYNEDRRWTPENHFPRGQWQNQRDQYQPQLPFGENHMASREMWNLSSVKVSEYPEYFDDIEDQIAKGLPGTADPTKAQPWRKGRPGKGYLDSEGNIHTWAVNQDMGAPHHQEISRLRGHEVAAPFYIEPYGGVTADPWIESHHLQTLETQLPHHKLFLDKDKPEDDLWSFAKMATLEKTADKLNDFLMNPKSRPDLQTPEAQNFLTTLRNNYHNPQTDPMTPWLTREWKKKRLTYAPDGHLQYQVPGQAEQTPLTPAKLNSWAEWYGSNHPTRRGVDLMQKKPWDIHDLHNQYQQALQAEKGPEPSGEVQHRLPNGWTIQKLMSPQALTEEGDIMGHCVGGYHNAVADGDTKIYSLRDDKNIPHVTMEVQPDPDGGTKYKHPHSLMHPAEFVQRLNDPHIQTMIRELAQEKADRLGEFPLPGEIPIGPEDVESFHHDYHGQLLANYMKNGIQPSASLSEIQNAIVPPQIESGPHEGLIEQIQGKGNSIPKPEYQAMIKHWMETIPPEQRPRWKEDQEGLLSDFDEISEVGNGGYGGGIIPHGDYGVEGGGRPEYDWEGIIDSIHPTKEGHEDPIEVARIINNHHDGTNEEAHDIHRHLERAYEEAMDRHNEQFHDDYHSGWSGAYEDRPHEDDLDEYGEFKYKTLDPDQENYPGEYVTDHDRLEEDQRAHEEDAQESWYRDGDSEAREEANHYWEILRALERNHNLRPGGPRYNPDHPQHQERMGSWDFTPSPEPKSLEWTFPGTSRVVAASGSEALWSLTPA